VSDHSIPFTQDVQHLGQRLSPDEIGQELDALALQEAEATRIALECRLKRAKLLLQVVEQHGYKGKQFVEFARKHGGANRTDAYDMLLLTEADDDVLAPHDDPYSEYPHWRTVWREIKERHKDVEDKHWLTPPELDAIIREEIGDYHDPCPYPLPDDHDALEVEWGDPSYCNAPFLRRHEKHGRGLTAFVYKSIAEAEQGKTIYVVLPVPRSICQLLEAGATVRSLGRIAWLHADTREPMQSPVPCALFVLRPDHPDAANDNRGQETELRCR
jgi:hypothetical protein